uniref:Uncharacterized protein n=1 Tax=Chenopodium quinoa TaxID=63459 RepID=A0A803MN41_CHEQI
MPGSKRTSYQPQAAYDVPPLEAETSRKPGRRQVGSSSSEPEPENPNSSSGSDREEDKSHVHESAVNSILQDEELNGDDEVNQGDVVNADDQDSLVDLMEQVTKKEGLDEGYNSEVDTAEHRHPIDVDAKSKISTTKINEVWRKLSIEKDYCRHAKRLYRLPDGNLHWIKRDCQSEGWWSIYTAPRKFTVNRKLSSCKGWQDKFFFMRVPDDYPLRRTFFNPHSHFDSIADRGLGIQERKAFDYFGIEEIEFDDDSVEIVPKVWVPNVKYILGNSPLSHIGIEKLDRKILGLSADGKRVLKHCPPSPKPAYDTLATFCNRSSSRSRNPKRKAERMADDNAKRGTSRHIVSLANRRGGMTGAFSLRGEDELAAKKTKRDDGAT